MFSYVSVYFIFFLMIFLTVYCLMPGARTRQAVILLGNIVFYMLASGSMQLLIVFASSIIVYLAGRAIEKTYEGFEEEAQGLKRMQQAALLASYKKRARRVIVPAIALILIILIYGKVGNLLSWTQAGNFSDLLHFRTYILPLGISYYTFSSIGYLVDLYKRKAKCEHNYILVLICMTYFPHIVEGPISRYDGLFAQFRNLPGFSYRRVCFGMQRAVWGYFKKLVLADRIALFTSTIYSAPAEYSGAEIIVAAVLGAVQMYADFSGCMDIVIGISEAVGVRLEENFNCPFFAKTAAEFWQRWHITLCKWFREYLFYPIATGPLAQKLGKKCRKFAGPRLGSLIPSYVSMVVVWFMTGLWHGTGLDYIAWGVYWGIIIMLGTAFADLFKKLEAALRINTESFAYETWQIIRTFLLFCLGRMLTVTGSLTGFFILIRQLFRGGKFWIFFDGTIYNYGLDRNNFTVVLLGMAAVWFVDFLHERKIEIRKSIAAQPAVFRWGLFYIIIFTVLIFGQYGPGFTASDFVYRGF